MIIIVIIIIILTILKTAGPVRGMVQVLEATTSGG